MNRQTETANILANCRSLTQSELAALPDEAIRQLNAVDTNWCENADDISLAIFSTYELIISGKV